MDPEVTLALLRECIATARRESDAGRYGAAMEALREGKFHADSLRTWLRNGGYAPTGTSGTLADYDDTVVYVDEGMEMELVWGEHDRH